MRDRSESAHFKIELTPGQKITELADCKQMKLIGEGANAKVFRAYFKDSDRFYIYAIKMFQV